MSDFKAEMHQIRFPLGLCPRPRWGAYSAPQTPVAVFKEGGYFYGSAGYRGRGWKVKGRRRKKRGKGRERRRRESICWTSFILLPVRLL